MAAPDFRRDKAHQDALMEDAERAGAPDGTRVDCWTLWTDAANVCHWLYDPVEPTPVVTLSAIPLTQK